MRKRDLQEMESLAKKTKKFTLREEEVDYESDGDPTAQSASSAALKEKIKAAREENQKMGEGHFDERIHCPLCHMICSERTNDNGDTYIWRSNKCARNGEPS